MSKSGIRQKYTADAIQLHRISHPASPTYKEGPSGRANGRAMHNAYKERYQGPHLSKIYPTSEYNLAHIPRHAKLLAGGYFAEKRLK